MKKEEEIQWTEGTMTKLGKVKIIRQGQVEEEKETNRKKLSVKKLQEECKKRNIGFMTSWTKAALIKRLEDEDNRDKELLKLKKQLEEVKAEPKNLLDRAQENLKKYKAYKIELEGQIKDLHDEKTRIGAIWLENNDNISETEALIKSLI
tara:strand:- start:85 stop:534 length:450 start_codon:yes stop_codon:yes gene_type:complete